MHYYAEILKLETMKWNQVRGLGGFLRSYNQFASVYHGKHFYTFGGADINGGADPATNPSPGRPLSRAQKYRHKLSRKVLPTTAGYSRKIYVNKPKMNILTKHIGHIPL